MISDTQREALSALAELWALAPDLRLGQLLVHLGFLGDVHVGKNLGDIDDDELVAVMYRHWAELTARVAESPQPTLSDSPLSVSGNSMVADV